MRLYEEYNGEIDGENWLPVKDYVRLYEVSDCGRVRRVSRSKGTRPFRILKPIENNKGYFTVSLSKGNSEKRFLIHRLVALSFIKNDLNLPVVNHKDGNAKNNFLSNLEWVTHSDNHIHAYRVLGKKHPFIGKFGKLSPTSKAVLQFDLAGRLIKKFFGVSEASRLTGCDASDITKVCKGKRTSSKGYFWSYANE